MRLHVGCGAVLLRDWVNVDLPLPHVFLANERHDLVAKFITTEKDYYGRHEDKSVDSLRAGPVTQETCCDVYGSFAMLPARTGAVSQILSVQCFEHLDRRQAAEAIEECARVLKPGGILTLDIPDPDATVSRYKETGDEFWLRHLFGPRRNVYGFHTHYTRDMLRDLVEEHGLKCLGDEEHGHFYPAIRLKFENA